jgi:hypothetical protein
VVEGTRCWYRDNLNLNPTPTHELDPESEPDEMVLVLPCEHSFESRLWDDFGVQYINYNSAIDKVLANSDNPEVIRMKADLNTAERNLRVICETMDRTPPKGVSSGDVSTEIF